MTRDGPQVSPPNAAGVSPPGPAAGVLDQLGWQAFFARQTDPEALAATPPVRVVEQHRSGLRVLGDTIDAVIPPGLEATVGDWLLYDAVLPTHSRVLERKSLIQRRAPGKDRRTQAIAANLDTMFVVTSCNEDFNVARLERYVALAFDAGVTPVIVLTKADLCADTAPLLAQAQAISPEVVGVALNAREASARDRLGPWCAPGQTVGFVGSSGVGKSTLVNALFGAEMAATGGIREDDAKGRHTTTARQVFIAPGGCAVLDTPGMREIQLTDSGEGLDLLFADLMALAATCRFRDCGHESEPGCAVRAAVEAGEIDAGRLARWRKLAAEEAYNTAALHERRAADKSFGKKVRKALKSKRK